MLQLFIIVPIEEGGEKSLTTCLAITVEITYNLSHSIFYLLLILVIIDSKDLHPVTRHLTQVLTHHHGWRAKHERFGKHATLRGTAVCVPHNV